MKPRSAAPVECFISLCLLLLSACVPAQSVPHLANTPGAAFVVTDGLYQNALFSVRYPKGWQVVTGQADQPPSVIFVAPDTVSYIRIHAGAPDNDDLISADFKSELRTLTLENDLEITALLRATSENEPNLRAIFENVLGSLK